MKIWFDTEFMDDGKTIELLSIGLIREDGARYYAEPAEADRTLANEWVRGNVLPSLTGPIKPRVDIAIDILEFAGDRPEFWAYHASYDWVALCQLYGPMVKLPKHWPQFCMDLQQLVASMGGSVQQIAGHNALADAVWCRETWGEVDRKIAYSHRVALAA